MKKTPGPKNTTVGTGQSKIYNSRIIRNYRWKIKHQKTPTAAQDPEQAANAKTQKPADPQWQYQEQKQNWKQSARKQKNQEKQPQDS